MSLSIGKNQLEYLFEGFTDVNALIIGDVMVDAYYWGRVDRISPEAPVPIISVTKQENRLGGAANVALNVQALNAYPILCSVIGNDEKGKLFKDLMRSKKLPLDGILTSDERTTTVKTRIIGHSQQMLRVDEEDASDISDSEADRFFEKIKQLIGGGSVHVVVFEDYNKGVITESLIQQVTDEAHAHGIPVVVDPKKKNFANYRNADLFKPNLKELREGLKVDLDEVSQEELDAAFQKLQDDMCIGSTLITLSEKGVYAADKNDSFVIPAHLRDIADVSGAGDTVISVAALCFALKKPIDVTAVLANMAGGLVCEKVGVVPINRQQLLDEALSLIPS